MRESTTDEELLFECLTGIVVLKDILNNAGLSAGKNRAIEIIKKLTERLNNSEFKSEIPPRYNSNLKIQTLKQGIKKI